MKTHKFMGTKGMALILFTIFLSSVFLYTSCKKEDDEDTGTPYFNIEGDPTGLTVGIQGLTQSYTVRSNQEWKVVAQSEANWVKVFADEGKDDGIFKIIVEDNLTFDTRSINFAFVVGGEEQPVLFRVDQEANVPFINITNGGSGIQIPSAEGEFVIDIESNVNWAYSINDASWLTEQSVSDNQIVLLANRNMGPVRTAKLTVTSTNYPSLSEEVTITQSSGSVILEENFSWLTYGSTVPYEYKDCVRYDSWTQEEQNKGWTVTPNEFSSNQPLCYACYGFVKLGKTSYGGDLISEKLDIEGTVNLKVTFKSAVYISSGGSIDDRVLKVFALGAGQTSVSEFTIDNVPNSKAQDEAGIVNDIWAEDRAYSFTITGATSNTQIKFLGGDYYLKGVGKGKNRIFLDDIKVEVIQ